MSTNNLDARITVRLNPTVVATAKELHISIPDLLRDALAKRIAELEAARDADMRLIKTHRNGEAIAFWGRLLATHPLSDLSAFVTEKGRIVLIDCDTNPRTGDVEDQIMGEPYETIDDFLAQSSTPPQERGSDFDWGYYQCDQEFAAAVAAALGTDHHRIIDL